MRSIQYTPQFVWSNAKGLEGLERVTPGVAQSIIVGLFAIVAGLTPQIVQLFRDRGIRRHDLERDEQQQRWQFRVKLYDERKAACQNLLTLALDFRRYRDALSRNDRQAADKYVENSAKETNDVYKVLQLDAKSTSVIEAYRKFQATNQEAPPNDPLWDTRLKELTEAVASYITLMESELLGNDYPQRTAM